MTSESQISDTKQIPFFFILGRPRSGTTLLASLFDAHPNVMLPFECPLIINLYSRYSGIHLWTEELLDAFATEIIGQRKFDSWRVDELKFRNALRQCTGNHDFESIMKVVYLQFNSLFDKKEIRLIGDKNPVYSIYPERLARLFPNARFIHLTRDYRDNILSIQKVDFEAPFTALLAYRWRFATNRIMKTALRYPDRFYTIRYEDLVTQPDLRLREMCSFLDIPYDPSVLDFHTRKEELFRNFDKEHVERYHSSLLQPISDAGIYAWKKRMPKDQVRTADFVAGKTGREAGYEPMFKSGFIRVLPSAFFGILYGYLAWQGRFLVDCLPFRMKMRIRNKGPLVAVLYNRYVKGK
jgi:hypothetical protein